MLLVKSTLHVVEPSKRQHLPDHDANTETSFDKYDSKAHLPKLDPGVAPPTDYELIVGAEVDKLRSFLIFIFPALGGLLFGRFRTPHMLRTLHLGHLLLSNVLWRGVSAALATLTLVDRREVHAHVSRAPSLCLSKTLVSDVARTGYDIGATSGALPILEDPTFGGTSW
jgi:hypothetical protein